MKVLVEGMMQFLPLQKPHITGWVVDSEGVHPTLDTPAAVHDLIVCVLCHVASRCGITLVEAAAAQPEREQPAPENFDAQREALDAIAVARWPEAGA